MKIVNSNLNEQSPEPLTIEKLRMFPGLEQLSDEQADEVIRTFNKLAEFLYDFVMEQEASENKQHRNEKSNNT